mmetsp:Transcript_1012/g.2287  ORF Transcript_1012/g.2287 Transcript_1012/m.2287 type:complete len:238 (+) Transcript_1012:156-869(+)
MPSTCCRPTLRGRKAVSIAVMMMTAQVKVRVRPRPWGTIPASTPSSAETSACSSSPRPSSRSEASSRRRGRRNRMANHRLATPIEALQARAWTICAPRSSATSPTRIPSRPSPAPSGPPTSGRRGELLEAKRGRQPQPAEEAPLSGVGRAAPRPPATSSSGPRRRATSAWRANRAASRSPGSSSCSRSRTSPPSTAAARMRMVLLPEELPTRRPPRLRLRTSATGTSCSSWKVSPGN